MSMAAEKTRPNFKKNTWWKGFSWGELLLIAILLIFAFFGPWIFTQTWFSKNAFGEEAAWVGDTIGGLTAPFLNLLAAVLVYKAFRAQIRANEIVQEHFIDEKYTTHSFELIRLSDKISTDIYNNCYPKIKDIVSCLYSDDPNRFEIINQLDSNSDEVKCFETTQDYVKSLVYFNGFFMSLLRAIQGDKDYSTGKYNLIETYLKSIYSINISEIMKQYNLVYLMEKNNNISFLATYDKKGHIETIWRQKLIFKEEFKINI